MGRWELKLDFYNDLISGNWPRRGGNFYSGGLELRLDSLTAEYCYNMGM